MLLVFDLEIGQMQHEEQMLPPPFLHPKTLFSISILTCRRSSLEISHKHYLKKETRMILYSLAAYLYYAFVFFCRASSKITTTASPSGKSRVLLFTSTLPLDIFVEHPWFGIHSPAFPMETAVFHPEQPSEITTKILAFFSIKGFPFFHDWHPRKIPTWPVFKRNRIYWYTTSLQTTIFQDPR